MTNFTKTLQYPDIQVELMHATSNEFTVFYSGASSNNIEIVSRVREYHSKNCNTMQNLRFFQSFQPTDISSISALDSGPCTISFMITMSKYPGYAYHLTPLHLRYSGSNDSIKVVSLNESYLLFEMDRENVGEWKRVSIYGTLISYIIPPNGTLFGKYYTQQLSNSWNDWSDSPSFYQLSMSRNYPYLETPNYNITHNLQYIAEAATFTLTIFAYIPEKCIFSISDGNGTFYFGPITNQTWKNRLISFNGTQFFVKFTGTDDPNITWKGFFVRIEGKQIINNETILHVTHSKGHAGLIIGLSCAGLVITIVAIGVVTWYQLRKRYEKFNQLCQVLRSLNMTPDEIMEFKEKTDAFLVPAERLHISFDAELGRGSKFTVFKGRLIGAAPLHLMQRSIKTQRFVDCNVAVKVAARFDADQIYKEIELLKKIEYHENIMGMLGWALIDGMPHLVCEIAEKNLLDYVMAFKDEVEEEIPYKKIFSILWQISRGKKL